MGKVSFLPSFLIKSAVTPKPTLTHLPTLKATMEYYRTRDIFHVMQLLGHRKIENTLLYMHLANSIFHDHDDQYVCKVAKNA